METINNIIDSIVSFVVDMYNNFINASIAHKTIIVMSAILMTISYFMLPPGLSLVIEDSLIGWLFYGSLVAFIISVNSLNLKGLGFNGLVFLFETMIFVSFVIMFEPINMLYWFLTIAASYSFSIGSLIKCI